ncbi:MAG: OmpH family outer membrane protein [Prevotella sp.]|nr:OmpH family outer membrane protein [Prevotella sp.]
MKQLMKPSAILGVAAMMLASCNQAPKAVENKKAEPKTETKELKIAFVEVDSIMTQYEFCKEFTKVLEQKGKNIQRTISQKEQALRNAANNFQQKLQQNAYTREEAERVQAGLQKQDADLAALQQRLGNEFQAETEKYNIALRDSIQHYLAKYNKNKKYSIIFSKQGDNLLYTDNSYDITKEVIAGLNKAYKPAEKKLGKK